MELNERKLAILQAVVDDYIMNAEPVGSRTIAKKYNVGISSATIRNEMSDLEELGYLIQPHTSAGRIPSDKGYRLYVDNLMRVNELSEVQAREINRIYKKHLDKIETIIVNTAKIISDLTKYTSLVLAPQLNNVMIKNIEIIQVASRRALLIIVTNAGIIKDVIIKLPSGITREELHKISRLLTSKFRGKTVSEVDISVLGELKNELARYKDILNNIVDNINKCANSPDYNDIYLDGATNIFNFPEYNDVLKAKGFLSIFEEKSLLIDLLTMPSNLDLEISIGQENEYEEMHDCSVIKATYKIGDKKIGTIGVIGPTRMQYANVITLINFIKNNLSDMLTNMVLK
ncbi:MAG: heat-inducible transcriptional repressor HrcA [Clostridia bacterium]|nr:heat-inducible transcriptional repressor HrcA [Clostridia bacterium]